MKSIIEQQHELAAFIERHTGKDGVYETKIPSLLLFRESHPTTPKHGVQRPAFCLIVQGRKDVWLAGERFTYNPTHYLVASVDLPVISQVVEASEQTPYLALRLEMELQQIIDLLQHAESHIRPLKKPKRAMFVSQIEPDLLDAVTRLIRLLDAPNDIDVLAPMYQKEILYRVLQGPYGDVLKQMAIQNSHARQIHHVIEYIKEHYHQPIRIEELADLSHMSTASLHRHFKEVTGMSPIQFQKQLRLQEARRLLLTELIDAADVAFQVGYESPSQFSREYARLFGRPPKEDAKRLRAEYGDRANA
ncbi:AraC family transcriptional regulator [Geobacillus sp. 46C-IIa]|uniref:AraC family transcriptional regulator n=1 Tax=Geobacillus sp. 46C-IIa TaxID=1963025 RepID=UPI0009BCE65C|nr:AraC family transcriptional regulator [Geobacillus sp. 46C-IIa]OQP06398.1 AraC family transcriptional regulator [Geobacillus sp. 46C-IIa]QNU28610.1 AraC family transcriptional regulator [Geobacillus sp. 46C-IIa]